MANSSPACSSPEPTILRIASASPRKMVRAELLGCHTHTALCGTRVHVWKRDPTFLARGRYHGRPFGETLGSTVPEASARLRQLLGELENGSFVPPCERRRRIVSHASGGRLTLRELIDAFLHEKRQTRGKQTAQDYKTRLLPVLAFSDQKAARWPLAADIDRTFIIELRAFLFQYRTTRNGRPGANQKPLSSRQVQNILQCLRTLFAWASSPVIHKLPAGWANPLTHDLLGKVPAKDPLRDDPLPIETRVRMVEAMDLWQLCHLTLSMVLPLRPDEAAGLLVSDVNFERGWLEFGHTFSDCNFTKASTAFRLPFPGELVPILRACIGNHVEGPLLQKRSRFQGAPGPSVASAEELRRLYSELLLKQPAGSVQSPHDRKLVFRDLLRRLGGISEDIMNREFKRLLVKAGINTSATIYTLRSSVTTAMARAKLPHLEMRYLTSHSVNDILNVYSSLDPVGAMQQYFDGIRPVLAATAERVKILT